MISNAYSSPGCRLARSVVTIGSTGGATYRPRLASGFLSKDPKAKQLSLASLCTPAQLLSLVKILSTGCPSRARLASSERKASRAHYITAQPSVDLALNGTLHKVAERRECETTDHGA